MRVFAALVLVVRRRGDVGHVAHNSDGHVNGKSERSTAIEDGP